MWYITNSFPGRDEWVLCEDGQLRHPCGSGRQGFTAAVGMLAQRTPYALTASIGDGAGWVADPAIMFQGVETSDKRIYENGGGVSRDLPLPLMLQTEVGWGHDGAIIAGRIDQVDLTSEAIQASGVFLDTEEGQLGADLVSSEALTGISADLAGLSIETEIIEIDDEGFIIDWLDRFTEWEFAGATITPHPAFADARIRLADEAEGEGEDTEPTEDTEPAEDEDLVVIMADGGVDGPSADWFDDPQLGELTPITFSEPNEHGWRQMYGHVAGSNTCHIGLPGCQTAPTSATNYSLFHDTGARMRCADGCDVPVGVITMGGGHAPYSLGSDVESVRSHYDDVSTIAGYVRAGVDKHGTWVAGCVEPTLSEDDLRRLRASRFSGDWRRHNGSMELLVVHAVNSPGFPIIKSGGAMTASGEMQYQRVITTLPGSAADQPDSTRMLSLTRRLVALR